MDTFTKTASTVSKSVSSVASNHKVALTAICVKIMWAIAYYISIQSKANFCAPWTWYGIFIAPFISETPICSGLNWVEQTSRQVIREMWSVLGLWVVYAVFYFKNRKGGDPDTTEPPPPFSSPPPPPNTPKREVNIALLNGATTTGYPMGTDYPYPPLHTPTTPYTDEFNPRALFADSSSDSENSSTSPEDK